MVWLEAKDVDALEHATDIFRDIRDGRAQDPSYLANLSRPTFGFRVIKAVTAPISKANFLPGMQGVVLSCEGDGAYVKVRDLFDIDRQPLKDWVPRSAIEIGTKPYGTWQTVAPSPISKEYLHEGSQWLRTDGYMPGKSGETIPVSNFARTARKRATISTNTNGYLLVIFEICREKTEDKPSYSFRITRTAADKSDFNDIAWPAEGTLYNVRFEVRKDWKPHEYSWARLPLHGPFEDWDRANSWGVCIEWTDKTGQHRCRYLHCERPFDMLDDLSYGSIQAYARGIEMIHWMFKEKIPVTNQQRWLRQPPVLGNNLRVVKHNHVTQMITVEASEPATSTAPISGRRKHREVIKKEMQGFGSNGNAKLAYVGYNLAEVRKAMYPAKWGQRASCDTCWFRGSQHTCVWDAGKKVCKCCLEVFGRPFCSWTLDIPAANDLDDLEAKGDEVNIFRRKALLSLPGWRGTDTMCEELSGMEVDTGEDEDEDEEPME